MNYMRNVAELLGVEIGEKPAKKIAKHVGLSISMKFT